MKRHAPVIASVLVAGLLGACRREPPPPSEAELERARAALAPLKQGLRKALTEALASGGPAAAIDVCREKAPALAAAASTGGVEVGRTSHRLRNATNAPRPWAEPLLAAYQADDRAKAPAHRAVRLPDGSVGYVEPIWTAPECLTCHGETIAPEIAARLDAAYPSDRARGFREGDLRGVFWATVAATP